MYACIHAYTSTNTQINTSISRYTTYLHFSCNILYNNRCNNRCNNWCSILCNNRLLHIIHTTIPAFFAATSCATIDDVSVLHVTWLWLQCMYACMYVYVYICIYDDVAPHVTWLWLQCMYVWACVCIYSHRYIQS